ncbi:tail completion protein gp17 [Sphingobium algorifonticola]
MSAEMAPEMAVRAAALAALRGDAALDALLNGMFDGPPGKASAPYAILGDCIGADWGTKDAPGREVRLTLIVQDKGETGAALAEMLALADAAIGRITVPGWQVASARLLRSRIVRAREEGWRATVDYRVRVLG